MSEDEEVAYEPGDFEEELKVDSTIQTVQHSSNKTDVVKIDIEDVVSHDESVTIDVEHDDGHAEHDDKQQEKHSSNSKQQESLDEEYEPGSYSPSKFDDYIKAAPSDWNSEQGQKNHTGQQVEQQQNQEPTRTAPHIPPASILYTAEHISYDGLVRSTRGRIIDSYRPGGNGVLKEDEEPEIEEMTRKLSARVVDRYRPSPPSRGRDSYRPTDVNVNSIPIGQPKGSHSPSRRRSRSPPPPNIRPGGDRYRPGQPYFDPNMNSSPPYRDSYRPSRKRSRSISPSLTSPWAMRGPENADRYRPGEVAAAAAALALAAQPPPRRKSPPQHHGYPLNIAGRNTRLKIARDDLDNDLDNFIKARPEKPPIADSIPLVKNDDSSNQSKISNETRDILAAKIAQFSNPPPGSQSSPPGPPAPARPNITSRPGDMSDEFRGPRDVPMEDLPPRRDSYRSGGRPSERVRPPPRGKGALALPPGAKPLFTYPPGDPRARIITPPMTTEADFKPDPTLRGGHYGHGRGRGERGRTDPPLKPESAQRHGGHVGGDNMRQFADPLPHSPYRNETHGPRGGRYHTESVWDRTPSPESSNGHRYKGRENNNRRPASPGTPPKSGPVNHLSDNQQTNSDDTISPSNKGTNKPTRKSSRWGPMSVDESASLAAGNNANDIYANAHGDDEGDSQQVLQSSSSGSVAGAYNHNTASGSGYYGDDDMVDFDEELGSTAQ